MRKFISAATLFIMLGPGEKLKKSDIYGESNRIYVTWPVDNIWKVKYRWSGEWEDITDNDFASEAEAFNFAYDHFLNTAE